MVLNQRLLKRLCERCKYLDTEAPPQYRGRVFRARGCPACEGSGFEGRVLVSEALDLQSFRVKDLYGRATSTHEALSSIPSAAFIPWTHSLEHHLTRGSISIAQVDEFIDKEMVNE